MPTSRKRTGCDLDVLWRVEDPSALKCYTCSNSIGTEPLMRTFRLRRHHDDSEGSKIICPFPDDGEAEDIVLYHRHLKCARESKVSYVAISHVWHPSISESQARGWHSPQKADVRRLAFEIPMGLARDISNKLGREYEVWHDYMSVPQWSVDLKARILEVIHNIYGSAPLTVIHLDDVAPSMIQKFLHGSTLDERAKGMIAICNARWYSRVWTIVEFLRSPIICVMDSESNVYRTDIAGSAFHDRLMGLWFKLIAAHPGSIQDLEKSFEMGKNLVPWNLGELGDCRDPRDRNFGLIFSLLSRRGCRDETDFLYALGGTLTRKSVSELTGSTWDEKYLSIARYCIKTGDYTPLLMTPEMGELDVRNMPANNVREGFRDPYAYSLHRLISPPTHHEALRVDNDGNPIITMQLAGKVDRIQLFYEISLDRLAIMCVGITGPSVEAFVDAFASRLFFAKKDRMLQLRQRLPPDSDRYQKLEATLATLNEISETDPWPSGAPYTFKDLWSTLSDAFDLNHRFMDTQGTTVHLTWRHYFAWTRCGSCDCTSISRVGLWVPEKEALGALVYRIPGLEYQFSLKNGICLLCKAEGHVVGRMVWATPTCACESLEPVKLKMNLPRPRKREEFMCRLGMLR